MPFDLNVLFESNFFMILIIFFFVMTVEQCIDDEYVASMMSFRSAECDVEKNLFVKNRALFSKNVTNFSSTSLCLFLISVSIFDSSLKT